MPLELGQESNLAGQVRPAAKFAPKEELRNGKGLLPDFMPLELGQI
jgi:hypothetical protein